MRALSLLVLLSCGLWAQSPAELRFWLEPTSDARSLSLWVDVPAGSVPAFLGVHVALPVAQVDAPAREPDVAWRELRQVVQPGQVFLGMAWDLPLPDDREPPTWPRRLADLRLDPEQHAAYLAAELDLLSRPMALVHDAHDQVADVPTAVLGKPIAGDTHSFLWRPVATVSAPRLQPRAGEPLPDLTPEELAAFRAGRARFRHHFTEEEGLGPAFNDFSCSNCHNAPDVGGFSHRSVIRFGSSVLDDASLRERGGPVLHFEAINPLAREHLPAESDVQARRITPALFGLGLVEALPDDVLRELAAERRGGTRGVVHEVVPLEGGGARVGRFGHKSQLATLLSFSAEAALDELGITNAILPKENLPSGKPDRLAATDKVSDPEAPAGDLQHFTVYQQLLAAPPQTPRDGLAGATLFRELGCAHCHVESFSLPGDVPAPFGGRSFRPFSDFLLHDLGEQGDGLVQGAATELQMRTAPLWGLGQRRALMHDGLAFHPNLEPAVRQAMARHGGEASAAREAFGQLSAEQHGALLRFLASLGRLEFDADADHDVDALDVAAFWRAYDAGAPVEPDQPAAVFDVDADGFLGPSDVAGLISAYTGELASSRR